MSTCPTCGQTLPDKLPAGIRFYGKKKAQILALVHKAGKHGLPTEVIWQALYGADPNGGPAGLNVIAVHVAQMNRELRAHKMKISNTHVGRGAGGSYVLAKL